MPRPKKESRKRITVSADRKKMLYLLNCSHSLELARSPKAGRQLWEQYRRKIMPIWIDVLPGCRPWAFWEYDAPERRKAIEGVCIYTRRPDTYKRYSFGIPTLADYEPDGTPIDATYESEADYLARLDLLTEQEKALPLERLRLNSCDYVMRLDDDLLPVNKILDRLGF